MKRLLAAAALAAVVIAGIALVPPPGPALAHGATDGGLPCTFVSGQALTSSCLNRNFNHLHDTYAGGIVDSYVSSSAGIQHSKLQYPALLPKAFAFIGSNCTSTPCTLAESSRVTSIARASQGVYDVTLAYTPGNASFAVLVTPYDAAFRAISVSALSASAPQFRITVRDNAAAVQDSAFSILVIDSDN